MSEFPTAKTHRIVVKLALPFDLTPSGLKLLAAVGKIYKEAVVITDGPLYDPEWMIVAVPRTQRNQRGGQWITPRDHVCVVLHTDGSPGTGSLGMIP